MSINAILVIYLIVIWVMYTIAMEWFIMFLA